MRMCLQYMLLFLWCNCISFCWTPYSLSSAILSTWPFCFMFERAMNSCLNDAGLPVCCTALQCPWPGHTAASPTSAATAVAAAAAAECAALPIAPACHGNARPGPIPSHWPPIPSSDTCTSQAQARVDGAHRPRRPQVLLQQCHQAVQLDQACCPGRSSGEDCLWSPKCLRNGWIKLSQSEDAGSSGQPVFLLACPSGFCIQQSQLK